MMLKDEIIAEMSKKRYIPAEEEDFVNFFSNYSKEEVINALKEARALGDLSENAEYDAARNEQAEVEGKIKELELMLEKELKVIKTLM